MAYYNINKNRSGFTLIELSIVLVIIGLIVGGVLVGKDLINAAATRAQIKQIDGYQMAVNTFKLKYGFLPGDIPGTAATSFGLVARGSGEGQGDGNGTISGFITGVGAVGNRVFNGESVMAWVDMSATNLIEGSFNTATPTAEPNNGDIVGSTIELYMPKAKIGSGYIFIWSGSSNSPSTTVGYHYLTLAGSGGNIGGLSSDYANVAVAQAYSIDNKMDDGMPQTGKVQAFGTLTWATGGPLTTLFGTVLYQSKYGDFDVNTGRGITSATVGSNWSASVAADKCYYNTGGNVVSSPELYNLAYANNVNCYLSIRF